MPIVRIVSEDHRPWNLRFQQENVVIPPNGQTYVEWEKACFWFGDPGTIEERRRDEYNRKRTWYGFQEGFHTDDTWEELRPKLMVFDQSTGERILMVIDDPSGAVKQVLTTPTYDPQAKIAELEAKIELLLAGQVAAMAAPRPTDPSTAQADAASGIAGFTFVDPAGAALTDVLAPTPGDDVASIPTADPSTAGALADSPAQVGTGRKGR